MCQIIVGAANKVMELLSVQGVASSLYANNRDGVGLMYRAGNKVVDERHIPKNYLDMANWLNTHVPDCDVEVAIHFRMATHGDICPENIHPYPVVDGGLLMHNGILRGFGTPLEMLNPLRPPKKEVARSDTYHFIEQRIKPLLAAVGWGGLKDLHDKIGHEIGSGNRLVYLSPVPGEPVQIVNKHTGLEHPSGVWFANDYSFDSELLFPHLYRAVAKDYGFGSLDDIVWNDTVWNAIDTGDFETLYEMANEDLEAFIKALLN